MSNIYIKGLAAGNVSISGDEGLLNVNVSTDEIETVEVGKVVGNILFCDTCAAFITAGKISARLGNPTTGHLLSASEMGSIKSGTIFDLDDNALLDYAEAGVIHATDLKATPVGADELILEDSADSWAKKRATVTSLAAAVGTLDPCISTADGTLAALANKATPVGADIMLIEDSATANAQMHITITDLAAAIAAMSPPEQERVVVTGVLPDTLNDEQSQALAGAATDEWVPTEAIVHMEDVGAGVAATGDFQITIGITPGGDEILAAAACTGVSALNTKLVMPLTVAQPSIPGDSTIYVKVTAADSTAGAGHLVDVYLRGEIFPSGS